MTKQRCKYIVNQKSQWDTNYIHERQCKRTPIHHEASYCKQHQEIFDQQTREAALQKEENYYWSVLYDILPALK